MIQSVDLPRDSSVTAIPSRKQPGALKYPRDGPPLVASRRAIDAHLQLRQQKVLLGAPSVHGIVDFASSTTKFHLLPNSQSTSLGLQYLTPMTLEITDVKMFALSAAVLYIKFLACTMIQGRKAFAAGTRMAEDSKLPQARNAPPQGFADLTDDHVRTAVQEEMRWKRIIQNDLESMPMAYVVFWSAICVQVNAGLTKTILLVYTVARVGHTVVYSQGLAKARMTCWIVGMACIVISVVSIVLAALT